MLEALKPDFVVSLLRPADANSNKYNRGVVGFVTGSDKYPGAALLGINAAHELSVGMCEYLGPKSVSDLVLANRPETVLGISKSKVLVVGSGIPEDGTDSQLGNLRIASQQNLPMVIDAGALQLMDLGNLSKPAILTPHLKEAERLFARLGQIRSSAEINARSVESAEALAELTGLVVLLKGNTSVLALSGKEPIELGPGSPHLATAGTGDLLAGMIGALAAKFVADGGDLSNERFREVATLACWLHSKAAEIAAARGEYGASLICEAISEAAGIAREMS